MFTNISPTLVPLMLLVVTALILFVLLVIRRKRPVSPDTAGLGAFRGLREELARAAESGGTVHISVGSGEAYGDDAMVSLAGLRVGTAVADVAVSYGLEPTVSVGHPTLLPLAQDALLGVYQKQGIASRFAADQVRFVSPSPVGLGAGVGHEIAMEGAAVAITAGSFGTEVTLISDAAARRGIAPFVAVASLGAVGATWAATDRLAPGEALFAAAAEESGARDWAAGLATQDVLRLVLVAAILVAALWALGGG